MHFDGRQSLAVPQDNAWQFLTDPDQVGQCVPGLQSIRVLDPGQFEAQVGLAVGPVKATFTMRVEWLDLNQPDYARMKLQGNAPGSAVHGESEIKLTPTDDNSTALEWTADINISGVIASVGSRMMNSVTKKLTNQFFQCVEKKLKEG